MNKAIAKKQKEQLDKQYKEIREKCLEMFKEVGVKEVIREWEFRVVVGWG